MVFIFASCEFVPIFYEYIFLVPYMEVGGGGSTIQNAYWA